MQLPSRCRVPKNAPRAASHRTRGSCWENSAPSSSFRSRPCRCRIAPPTMTAGRAWRALELSAQPGQIFAASQNDGGRAEAGGCSQGDAEKGDPHVTIPHDCRRERDWSLCHRRLDCSGVMADDRLRLTRAIVQGSSTFIVDHISLLNPLREPRTISIFELGLVCRADMVRLHPKGNADFGWAVARWSCGPRSRSCRHGGHDGYWHSEMVQPDEGLWVHSAAGRRQRRIRPYLGGRAGRPELSQRGPSAQL